MAERRIPNLSAVASPPRRSLEYTALATGGEPIDAGGQAVIYEISLPDDGPPARVALKEPNEPGTLDEETVDRFLDEAATWETVDRRERRKRRWSDSEHIVGVIDTGETLPWIAMEYMDGGSLADRLDTHPDGLPLAEALWIGERLCRGVELAHNYGIAHLDLKPANVLFRTTPNGKWDVPKIADWGLARLLAERTGTIDGLSVEHAAPEQFEPETFGDPDMLTDIYQLGTLVYALLTGEPPYTGTGASVMYNVVHGDGIPAPSNSRSGLPKALDVAVQTALARSKADRYRSVTAFGQALRAIRTDEPLPPIVAQRVAGDTEQLRGTATRPASSAVEGPQSEPRSTVGSSQVTDRWAMFQAEPARTGHHTHGRGPQRAVTERWRFETSDAVSASPAVVDGTVYVGSSSRGGQVYALDARSGTTRWRFDVVHRVRSSPAVGDGTVYVGSSDEHVYALDATDGTKQWAFEAGWAVESSPMVADGTVYVGGSNTVYALAGDSGTGRWSFETGARVRSSPALANGTVYVGSYDSHVYALEARSGTEQWAYETGARIRSSPGVTADTVYVGSDDGHVYALTADSGRQRWAFETGDAVSSSPAVAHGTVYVGSHDGHVYALDAQSGTRQWAYQTSDVVVSSPVVVDGTVYVGSSDGHVYALDARSGTEQWAYQTGGAVESSPAVVNGTVYVGSHDKHVYALSEQ